MKKIYIGYCGKYNNAIGPVKSMNAIFNLLKNSQVCVKSNNLSPRVFVHFDNEVVRPNVARTAIKKVIKRVLSPLLDVFYILDFNFRVAANFYSKDVVIVTQPFLFIPIHLFGKKLIYTRRANVPDKLLIANSFMKRVFERLFYSLQRYKVVFLVPQGNNSMFIPNVFNIIKIEIEQYSVDKKIFFAGTWNKRKGADEMAILLNNQVVKKIVAFGEVHQKLPRGVDHQGVISDPSSYYNPGDIFLSLSSLEGLQRSVMEALIKGCFVICFKRPDSIYLNTCPLVFLVDNLSDVSNVLHQIRSIDKYAYSEMYEESYTFLNENFSESVIERKWLSII